MKVTSCPLTRDPSLSDFGPTSNKRTANDPSVNTSVNQEKQGHMQIHDSDSFNKKQNKRKRKKIFFIPSVGGALSKR